MEVVARARHNSWCRVADYPRYGTGLAGWRDTLVTATTARAKEFGQEGFYSWLLAYAKAKVPASAVKGELPDPL